jgi:hypothetical protein
VEASIYSLEMQVQYTHVFLTSTMENQPFAQWQKAPGKNSRKHL